MTDTNARQMLYEEQMFLITKIWPFGFVDDGTPDHEKEIIDEYGDV